MAVFSSATAVAFHVAEEDRAVVRSVDEAVFMADFVAPKVVAVMS